MLAVGVDIGGTKCAVNLGMILDGNVTILNKCEGWNSIGLWTFYFN